MFEYVVGWPVLFVVLLEKLHISNILANKLSFIIADIIAFFLMRYMIKIVRKYVKLKINRILLYIFFSVIILFSPIIWTFLQLIYIFLGPIT